LTYTHLTAGKNPTQIREIDRILLGPEAAKPENVAKSNAQAMAALGQVGQLKPKKTKKPSA